MTTTQRLGSGMRRALRACADDVTRALRSASLAVGVGAVACIACCALPVLLAGLGLGTTAAFARRLLGGVEPHLPVAIIVLALGIAIIMFAMRHRTRTACATSEGAAAMCSIDRSCGCQSETTNALVCTLPDPGVGARASDFRALFQSWIATERPAVRVLVLRFRDDDGVEDRVRALAERERACCSFLRSEISRDGEDVCWQLSGPEGAEPALALFESLPARVASGLSDADARALIARANAAMRG